MVLLLRPSWRVWLSAMVLAAVVCMPAQAGEVLAANVEHDDGRFTVHSDILIQVSPARARALLTQFENLPKINSGIKKVRILQRTGDDQVRMRVETRVCILFLCRRYGWVQDVEVLPSGDIMTRIDPEVSDFREGWIRYRLLPRDGHTRLVVDARLVPDFWFPPLIGPFLIKSKLRNEALETALAVERLASRSADTK